MQRTLNPLAVLCLSLAITAISTPAQAPNTECPTITVDCPTAFLQPGEVFTVTASVTGADQKSNLSYNWTISSGTIHSGQGASSITVGELQLGNTFTATLEVGGLDPACENRASCSMTAHYLPPPSRRFDKYGDLAFADEKKRLDYYAEQLKNEPGSTGYIMVYGKRRALAGEAEARAARARGYLIKKGGIEAARLETLAGGERDRLTVELWLTPQGGVPPTALEEQTGPPESN